MTQFELYSLIFYALDAAWDENQDDELGEFLSAANPFRFKDTGSADPSVYEDFCTKTDSTIPVTESYIAAKNYIESLGKASLVSAFSTINESDWLEGAHNYLISPHKK